MSISGTAIDAYPLTTRLCGAGELVVAYTTSKPISWPGCVLLKQLVLLTSGTSSGSANVMSAHCRFVSSDGRERPIGKVGTHVIQGSTVLRCLDDLDGRIVAN